MITRADGESFVEQFNQIGRKHGVQVELVGSLKIKGTSTHDIDVFFQVINDDLYELFQEDLPLAEHIVNQMGGKLQYNNVDYECYCWNGFIVDVFYISEHELGVRQWIRTCV